MHDLGHAVITSSPFPPHSRADPTSLNLQRVITEECSPATPLLVVTTPGADPTRDLEELAARTVGAARYRQIAMGQVFSSLPPPPLRPIVPACAPRCSGEYIA